MRAAHLFRTLTEKVKIERRKAANSLFQFPYSLEYKGHNLSPALQYPH